jgi:hypothetical protein
MRLFVARASEIDDSRDSVEPPSSAMAGGESSSRAAPEPP